MRLPRIRFTVGRLIVAGIAVGMALWVFLVAHPQIVAERQALNGYWQAMLDREVAESAIRKYIGGTYQQEKANYLAEITLAKANQDRAIDRLQASTARMKRGSYSRPLLVADQLTKQQADFDLEQAQTQLQVLEGYTKEKRLKPLRGKVDKARAFEVSKFATYRMERTRRWWWVLSD